MKKPDLKAVLFDVDDTLFSTTEFATLARKHAVAAMIRHGLRAEPAQLLRELEEVIAEFSSNYEHHFDKLLLRLPERATRGLNPVILVAAGMVAYHDAKFTRLRPFPDVLPALRRLARTPLLRGLITDGLAVKQAEKILRLGVFPLMTPGGIFISDQIGISKPNPKLFERACTQLGVEPARAMYVGDHPLKDVDPPNHLGMVTVLVERGGRHGREKGRTKPRYRIRDFSQLLQLLRKDFNLPA